MAVLTQVVIAYGWRNLDDAAAGIAEIGRCAETQWRTYHSRIFPSDTVVAGILLWYLWSFCVPCHWWD